MKTPASRPYVKMLLSTGAAAVAAVSLTGCGLFGKSWDVKMEVTGTGTAEIGYAFSGDNDRKTATMQGPSWTKAQNVGFGFNGLAVKDAAPGTVCRIYVDGKLQNEQNKPDAKGTLSCSIQLKD